MSAGAQRWWRDDSRFERECVEYDARQHREPDPTLLRCVTEDGIELRLRLYCTRPMYYGTITLQ